MIPLQLTLAGVYSYREEQTIDFETLTRGNLFGIFGSVGSGKSAILDAVTYALYDQIDRLNKGDQRGYNMMNLQSDRLFIDFRFRHEGEIYRFTVSAKRQKKNYQIIQTPERQGYRLAGDEWVPLPDPGIRGGITAETVLGLSYDHFRRTVIIPQGKFQEFIQLTPSQRTGMIESLFGLEQFNLYGKTGALLSRTKDRRAFLEGRMEELGRFGKEELKELEDRLSENALRLEDAEKKLREEKARLEELDRIRTALDEEQSLNTESAGLEKMKPAMDERMNRLKEYRLYDTRFRPALKQLEEIRQTRKERSAELSRLEAAKTHLQEEEGREAPRWEALLKDWENRDRLQEALRSREAQETAAELTARRTPLKGKAELLEGQLAAARQTMEEQTRRREEMNLKIQEEEGKLPDWSRLAEAGEWYARQARLEQERQDLRKKAETRRLRLQAAGELLGKELLSSGFPIREQSPEGALADWLRGEEETVGKDEERLRTRQVEFRTEQKLLALSGELRVGSPCPVCGAMNHPAPLTESDSRQKEQDLENAHTDLKKRKTLLEERRSRLTDFRTEQEHLRRELAGDTEKLEDLDEQIRLRIESFGWPEFLPRDERPFREFREESEERQKSLQRQTGKLRELDREIDARRKTMEETERRFGELRLNLESLAVRMEEQERQILPAHAAAPLPPEELRRTLTKLHNRRNALDQEFPRLRQKREDRDRQIRRISESAASVSAVLEEAGTRRESLEAELEKELNRTPGASLESVRTVLSSNLDIAGEERSLEDYNRRRDILKDRLIQLKEKLEGSDYDGDEHRRLRLSLKELEEQKSCLLAERGALEGEIRSYGQKLREKQEQTEQLERALGREENLKELSSLFKGKKFVEYIAAIYLQELCRLANKRFFPLTGRSLELVFEDNNILVRDYLNEGKTRLVKTLSGGQTFQAALSLALALAEQTGRGGESFFFLDEGFGTLDRESLETVMTTLRNICREGRIIGLISHVEDLQQDLDVWLKIDRTPDSGSTIQCSWTGG